MASGYSVDFNKSDGQELADTWEFLYDSPQPETQTLPSGNAPNPPPSERKPASAPPAKAHASPIARQYALSSTSEEEGSSASSASSARLRRHRSSTSSPPDPFKMNNLGDGDSMDDFKVDKIFDTSMDSEYDFESSTFPTGEQGMNDLNLNSMDPVSGSSNLDFGSAMSPGNLSTGMFGDAYSPRNLNSMKPATSMQDSPMTVQPSKMFAIGDSREESPNSAGNMNSNEGTPPPFYSNSPMTGNGADGFTSAPGSQFTSGNPAQFQSGPPTSVPGSVASPVAATTVNKWQCQLTVDPTPEKSRVETQIPIRLTLSKVPPGITRLHLPTHTISKPKFQTKPPHQLADDCLELSTMLVCASAMQKGQEVQERALDRALSDDIPIRKDDNQSNQDETDPTRPLNGGPVTICSGCIVRERKRAARKKTKKQDEEEEWAKDEAKRVIVFNCPENRDWCVPGTKETPVKDHDAPLDTMFVNAPMRIACYCRHQSEKVGFQVIFTLKTSTGQVIAQAISNSIMITDDHKQPMAQPGGPAGYALTGNHGMPNNGIFTSGQAYSMIPTFQQDMPFRTSFSTNDLQSLRMQMQPQFGATHAQFQQQMAANGMNSEQSTATATPRNLSRPASPTDPSGHSTKKRRSGGLSRASSGLTMTRLDTTRASPSNGNGPMTGPSSAAPPSSGFSFTPSGTGFNSPMDTRFPQHALRNPNYQNGPQNAAQQIFGSPQPEQDPYQFYSAPTSQHASRAGSPSGGHRMPSQFSGNQVPQQAASALSTLPNGFNLQNPPIIQRVIPAQGSKGGGDEVTILGSGFCKGLDLVFGENVATNTVYWGENAISCRSPPSSTLGHVQVVFKHQHHTAPSEIRQVQALMPSRLMSFCYQDDEQAGPVFNRAFGNQQQIPLAGTPQSIIPDGSSLSPDFDQDAATRQFLSNQQQGFSNFNRGAATGAGGRMAGR